MSFCQVLKKYMFIFELKFLEELLKLKLEFKKKKLYRNVFVRVI